MLSSVTVAGLLLRGSLNATRHFRRECRAIESEEIGSGGGVGLQPRRKRSLRHCSGPARNYASPLLMVPSFAGGFCQDIGAGAIRIDAGKPLWSSSTVAPSPCLGRGTRKHVPVLLSGVSGADENGGVVSRGISEVVRERAIKNAFLHGRTVRGGIRITDVVNRARRDWHSRGESRKAPVVRQALQTGIQPWVGRT